MLLIGERPGVGFYAGLVIMVVSTCFMIRDTLQPEEMQENSQTPTAGNINNGKGMYYE